MPRMVRLSRYNESGILQPQNRGASWRIVPSMEAMVLIGRECKDNRKRKIKSQPIRVDRGGGISLPDYQKPWPTIKNRNFYAPGTETLPKNEMRISFMGSAPFPVSKEQSNAAHADRRYWRADQSPGVDREVRSLHRAI